MRLGITAALTDLDCHAGRAGLAVEELGFDSLYLPEHTHLPVREDVPPALVEGVRLDDYKRCLDPLVALSTAAAVTTRIGLGTGILLVAQHDPIVLAKQVATLDHLSGGRVTLGVGFGWNRAEAEDHGVDFAAPPRRGARAPGRHGGHLVRPSRPSTTASSSTSAPTWSWPKPLQQPRVRDARRRRRRRRGALGGRRTSADGWIPIGGRGLGEAIPRLRALAEAAGRDPAGSTSSPSAPSPTRASSSTTPAWACTEVVLRIRAGDQSSMRAELESLAPLVPFAATLEQP